MTAQLVRFGVVGATNTLVTFVTYAVLVALGAPAAAAAAIGFAAGAANGYRLNRGWTFRSAARGVATAARYVSVQAAGAGVDALAVAALVGHQHLPRLEGEALALPAVTLLTFLLCRSWVFGGRG